MLTEVKGGMALGWGTEKDGNKFQHNGENWGYECRVVGFADLVWGEEKRNDGDEQAKIPMDCGVCIMTSSMLGQEVWSKIIQAIPYLKGWPSLHKSNATPFVDRSKPMDRRAFEWAGSWGAGDWMVIGDSNDGMSVKYRTLTPWPLIPAAISSNFSKDGHSFNLVVDGLEMMLCLGWKDSKRIIEVWQNNESTTLER